MEEEEGIAQQPLLWKSEPKPESIVSVTLARSMTSLLDSRPKKLNDAITGLSSPQPNSSTSPHSLQHSLRFLHKYVTDAAHSRNHSSLYHVLVPIVQNSLKSKESKHGGQGMILLSWLFQDELLFEPVAEALAGVVARKEDRYLLLGWCVFVRSLVEYDNSVHLSMLGGIKGRYGDLLKILSTCFQYLAGIVSKGSGFSARCRMVLSCHLA